MGYGTAFMADAEGLVTYGYHFRLPNGTTRDISVSLRRDTLSIVPQRPDPLPPWTRLTLHQCPNCPLNEAEHPECPVAANLAGCIHAFGDIPSYERCDVRVEAPGRTYLKSAAVQSAVSPLVGLVMVTSGCPVLDRLRPMADTHLPFMTEDESTYRLISMYLVAQYFRMRAGRSPDWDLANLVEFFGELAKVNESFCKRLNATGMSDATVNAVVILDTLRSMTGFSIQQDELDRIERIFRSSTE